MPITYKELLEQAEMIARQACADEGIDYNEWLVAIAEIL